MSRNIVLVGFMGVGKSVVANKLAISTKRLAVSTDEIIEKEQGKTIAAIFQGAGEARFRELERAVVIDLARKKELVIDCGGGIVLNQANIDDLKKNGTLFYLAASPEVIYERVSRGTHRPLLEGGDPKAKIKELLAERIPKYKQADYTIDTSHHIVDQTVIEINKLLAQDGQS